MLYAAGGALAFFLSFLLLGKKGKVVADKILMVWMWVLGTHLLLYYAVDSGFSEQNPFIYGIALPFPFLHGPLLYLYTASRVQRMPKNFLGIAVHFLPALAIYLYYIPFFVSGTQDQLEYVTQIVSGNADFVFRSVFVLMLAFGVAYVVLTLWLLKKHQTNLVQQYSNTDQRDLFWLRNLIFGLGAVWLVIILVSALGEDVPGDDIIYGTVVLFVVAMGYFGIREAGVFTDPPLPEMTEQEKKKGTARYERSGLKESQAHTIVAMLEKLMQEEELYLESNLSLKMLAEKAELPVNHISQVINQHYEKNFHDFVNGYRLAAFQAKVQAGAHKDYTLLALAFESGFSSKATFNKFFKKALGIPPSQYIRDLET